MTAKEAPQNWIVQGQVIWTGQEELNPHLELSPHIVKKETVNNRRIIHLKQRR